MDDQHLHNQKVLDLIILAGEILLQNGAEIFRVQETMEHIAKAYDIEHIDIFTVSNGIFVSIRENNFERCTQIKYIPLSIVHLGRVTAVNQLSREIVSGSYLVDEATEKLKEIAQLPPAPKFLRTLAASVSCACFCYVYGGSIIDSLVAFIAGIFLYLFILSKGTKNLSKVLKNILGSALVTIVALFLYSLGFGNNIDKIVIGSIIPLVPGVAITTSIRDYFNGDYLSGTIHITDALLVALCISIGVGTTFEVFNYLGLSIK